MALCSLRPSSRDVEDKLSGSMLHQSASYMRRSTRAGYPSPSSAAWPTDAGQAPNRVVRQSHSKNCRRAQAELGIALINEFVPVPGVEIVGSPPSEIQIAHHWNSCGVYWSQGCRGRKPRASPLLANSSRSVTSSAVRWSRRRPLAFDPLDALGYMFVGFSDAKQVYARRTCGSLRVFAGGGRTRSIASSNFPRTVV